MPLIIPSYLLTTILPSYYHPTILPSYLLTTILPSYYHPTILLPSYHPTTILPSYLLTTILPSYHPTILPSYLLTTILSSYYFFCFGIMLLWIFNFSILFYRSWSKHFIEIIFTCILVIRVKGVKKVWLCIVERYLVLV